MLAQDRHTVRVLAGLAAVHASLGDTEHSESLLSQTLMNLETAQRPQSAAAGANLAELYYAVTIAHIYVGNKQAALEALEKSIQSGWLDRGWLERDPALRPIQMQPRFMELLRRASQFPTVKLQL